MKKNLSLHKIVLSLIGFIFLWAVVTDAWGYSDRFFDFHNGDYIYAYLSRLIWVFPAILLIIKYSESLYLSRRELFSRPHFDKSLNIVLIVLIVYIVIMMFLNHDNLWINSNVNIVLTIIKFILVGCVEEIVFRGWGYNSLSNVTTDKKAVIISTVLFVMLHWPAYFIKFYRFGTFDLSGILVQSFSALVWGIIFCILMKKSKTIWNPIIAHAIYDTLCVIFIG